MKVEDFDFYVCRSCHKVMRKCWADAHGAERFSTCEMDNCVPFNDLDFRTQIVPLLIMEIQRVNKKDGNY